MPRLFPGSAVGRCWLGDRPDRRLHRGDAAVFGRRGQPMVSSAASPNLADGRPAFRQPGIPRPMVQPLFFVLPVNQPRFNNPQQMVWVTVYLFPLWARSWGRVRCLPPLAGCPHCGVSFRGPGVLDAPGPAAMQVAADPHALAGISPAFYATSGREGLLLSGDDPGRHHPACRRPFPPRRCRGSELAGRVLRCRLASGLFSNNTSVRASRTHFSNATRLRVRLPPSGTSSATNLPPLLRTPPSSIKLSARSHSSITLSRESRHTLGVAAERRWRGPARPAW